jgi:hypothetical protein
LKGGDLHSADGFAAEIRVASRDIGASNIDSMSKPISTSIGNTEIDILKLDGTVIEVKNQAYFSMFKNDLFGQNGKILKFREFIANSPHPNAKIWLYVKDASVKADVEAYLTAHSITDIVVYIIP